MVLKQRLSNMELCRLVSILLVMLVHSTFQSIGYNVGFGVLLLASFSIIGVNVFIMITGLFSAAPKKTSLANLIFICLFWAIVKIVVYHVYDHGISYRLLFFLTTSNWFIPCYIGLLFFAPVLNQFCDSVDKKTLWGVVFALLFIEIWFDWLPPNPSVSLGTNKGYSVFSFLVLYLFARAIRLYGLPSWFRNTSPFVYLACSFLLAFLGFALLKSGHESRVRWLFAYTNPVVILSSVAFLVTFERMSFQSKIVNHISKSTLAVLLCHSALFFLYTKQFKYLYDTFIGWRLIGYWTLSILLVFIASIVIDQVRLVIWQPIGKYLMTHIKNDRIF